MNIIPITRTTPEHAFPVFLRGLGNHPDKGLAARIEEQVRLELGRTGRSINLVRVYVEDVNGPRGGVDVACRIVIELPPRGCVTVSGQGANLSAVVAQTLERAALSVKRHLKRRLTRRRRSRTPRRLLSV